MPANTVLASTEGIVKTYQLYINGNYVDPLYGKIEFTNLITSRTYAGDGLALKIQRDGKPMRYFPIGAKAATHVELAVVEDLEPGTTLEVSIGAPENVFASLLLDIGLVEIEA